MKFLKVFVTKFPDYKDMFLKQLFFSYFTHGHVYFESVVSYTEEEYKF